VQLARVHLAFRLPPYGTDDWYAADLLATVLTGGRSSPLYRDLVYERQLAQDVGAFALPTELAGSFALVATARPEVAARDAGGGAARAPAPRRRRAFAERELERARNRRAHPALGGPAAARPARRPALAARHLLRRSRAAAAASSSATARSTAEDLQRCAARWLRDERRGGDRGAAGRRTPHVKARRPRSTARGRRPARRSPFRFPPFLHRRCCPASTSTPRACRGADGLARADPAARRRRATRRRARLASLTADLLDEGTERAAGPSSRLGRAAGRLALAPPPTGTPPTSRARCSPSTCAQALALLAEMALVPELPRGRGRAAAQAALAELMRRRSSPGALAEERFAPPSTATGAYGYPTDRQRGGPGRSSATRGALLRTALRVAAPP
jgi:zinc protease